MKIRRKVKLGSNQQKEIFSPRRRDTKSEEKPSLTPERKPTRNPCNREETGFEAARKKASRCRCSVEKEFHPRRSAAFRIRAYSNRPPHPTTRLSAPTKFFSRFLRLFVFFPAEGGARSMQSDLQPFPDAPPQVSSFFHPFTGSHQPFCLFPCPFSSLLRPVSNYAGFCGGRQREGRGKQNQNRGITCSP